MRRLLGSLLVVTLAIPALAVSAESSHGEYRDDFKNISYSGNDGSLEWSGSWYDSEDGDPGKGIIQVGEGQCEGNKCLLIDSNGLGLKSAYIKRQADLSVFQTVDWCFDMVISGVPPLTDAILYIEASTDGSNWATLDAFPILTSGGTYHQSYDLDDFLHEGTYIRYRVSGLFGAEISIDNVEVKGEFVGTGSTTTTTSPILTTITLPITTTTKATTTTSQREETTTTSLPNTTTTTVRAETTTTAGDETTTTRVATGGVPPSGQPPTDSGIRDTGSGLIADFNPGMTGAMDMGEVQVLGAELTADFSMAVEVFESAKIWIAVLALMIAAAIVSGMDLRRSRRQDS